MNPVKVAKPSEYSEGFLSPLFSQLAEEHMLAVRMGVWDAHSKVNFRLGASPTEFDDYLQEALIRCWNDFKRTYSGPAAPAYKSGESRTWKTWFRQTAKYGALNYHRALHPAKAIKSTAVCNFPDWWEAEDKNVAYDAELEETLQSMEKIIVSREDAMSTTLTAFMKCDLVPEKTFLEMGRIKSSQSYALLYWSMTALKHGLIMEKGMPEAFRFKRIGFCEAVEYVCGLRSEILYVPAKVLAMWNSYAKVILAAKKLGLDRKPIADMTAWDYYHLFVELRTPAYKTPEVQTKYLDRLYNLIDWFIDLSFLSENPLVGIDFYATKNRVKNPTEFAETLSNLATSTYRRYKVQHNIPSTLQPA